MNKSEMMRKPHWALINNVTVYHEGDERSRTNPGHGYPAHATTHSEYIPFATEAALLDAINRNCYNSFRIIKAEPLEIEVKTTVKIKE
jgi:hypothetical protein